MMSAGRIAAVVSLCLAFPLVSAGQTWRVGPDPFSLRHPTLPSIRLWHTGAPWPVLRFFETSDLTGTPSMVLDSEGLTLDGAVVCHWLDGDGMLGVERVDGSLIRAPDCPADLLIWSKVGDGGLGLPALLIGVSAVKAPIAEIRFRSRTFFFDLRDLPGDPNDSEDPPPFALPRKGDVGWSWQESQHVDDVRVGKALAKKLEDVEYAKFYHGIRKCFLGRDYRCLTEYLHPKFEMEAWWETDPKVIGRREFARIAWQTQSSWQMSLWQELAWCFLRGRPGEGGMTFSRGFFMCIVGRDGAKYGLTGCLMGE